MENRYKLLSNFINNELKITKNEVTSWIKEEIERQVKVRINNALQNPDYIKDVINTNAALIIEQTLGWSTDRIIKEALGETFIKNLDVTITQKK